MARKSLVRQVAETLLERIIDGMYPVDTLLPSEAALGASFDVSRVTVREALRTLAAQDVVDVRSGIGSVVNDVSRWRSLEAVLRHAEAHGESDEVSLQLLFVRRMFETEAATLAASRIDDDALARMERTIAEMAAAHESADVDRFVAADLEFHDTILRASGNVFLAAMFEPLTRVLVERRRETSSVPEIQAHAVVEHRNILAALQARDTELARAAMRQHMRQTLDDLRTHVLAEGSAFRPGG